MSDCFKGSHPIGEDLFKQVLVLWVLVLNHLGFILNHYCFFLSFLFAMGLFFWNIQGAASLSVREISRTWIEIGGCGSWKQVGWQAWRRWEREIWCSWWFHLKCLCSPRKLGKMNPFWRIFSVMIFLFFFAHSCLGSLGRSALNNAWNLTIYHTSRISVKFD